MHFVVSAKHLQQPCVVCGVKRPCTFCYGCGPDVVGQVHVCGPNKNGGACWNKLHDIRTGQDEDSLVKKREQKSPRKRKRGNQPRRWSHVSNREAKKPRLDD